MANITIITVGTLKEGYLKDAVSEYKKRLSQYAKVEEVNIKEEKIQNEDDPSEVKRALDAEADKIISAIPKGAGKTPYKSASSALPYPLPNTDGHIPPQAKRDRFPPDG